MLAAAPVSHGARRAWAFIYATRVVGDVSTFVVEVKRSARVTNESVARLVWRDGNRHRFETRSDAESWASKLSSGDTSVWVRAANPEDTASVDAYLVGRRRRHTLDGAFDKRRRRLRPPSWEQPDLTGYRLE